MKVSNEDAAIVAKSLAFDADDEIVLKAKQILHSHALEYVKTFPMWMRLNVCYNGAAGHSDDEVNWDTVREILTHQVDGTDINTIDSIEWLPNLKDVKSIEDLEDIRNYIIECQVGLDQPWRRIKCKQCKEDFTLSFNEVDWYLRKGFKLPKNCKYCRTGTEKPKIEKIIPKKKETIVKEEEPQKTAFQLAMEKAGIDVK